MWCRKERAFLSKIHNPFSHIRPETVCSGCLCTWGSMHFITLSVHASAPVYDGASLQSRSLLIMFVSQEMNHFLFEALSKNH